MFVSKLGNLKLFRKGVLSSAIILSVGSVSLTENAVADSAFDNNGVLYNDFLLDGLPEGLRNSLEKSVNDGVKALDKHIIDSLTKDFFSEDFLESPGGTAVKSLLGQVPIVGMFSSYFADTIFGSDSGPSAEEMMIDALTQVIHESEGRIIDAMHQIQSSEALSDAQSLFEWYDQYTGGDYAQIEISALKDFAGRIGKVRNWLEVAGGEEGGALRNLQVYMLVASLELSIWQKVDQAEFYGANPDGTPEQALRHFQTGGNNNKGRLVQHIGFIEKHLITGMAGDRDKWVNEFRYRDSYVVLKSVYDTFYGPALEILDDWRRIANLPRRDWADAEFLWAKQFKLPQGKVVQKNHDSAGYKLDLYPSPYEPLSVTRAIVEKYVVYPDGRSYRSEITVGSAANGLSFKKEEVAKQSGVVEYKLKRVCGYMMYNSFEQCMNPSYTNKLVLNISLPD